MFFFSVTAKKLDAKTKGSHNTVSSFYLSSASFNAVFIADSIFAPAAASSEGMGTP